MDTVDIAHLRKDHPQRIRRELAAADGFNRNLNFYEQCKRNQRFYHGDQWHGLKKSSKLQLMTQNFLQRPISYFIAMIVSDDIGFQVKPLIEGVMPDEAMDVLPDLVQRVMKRNDFNTLNRRIIKNAALECEGVLHIYFDDTIETSDTSRGDIKAEVLSTCSVLFGNPFSVNVQDQPYILLKRRVPIAQMRERAESYGFQNAALLQPDTDTSTSNIHDDISDDRITEVIKYWRETKTVQKKVSLGDGKTQTVDKEISTIHFCRYAGDKVIQKDTDTGLTLYPIARMNWNDQQDCYHGSCPITAFIPTQITVNRLLTLVCEYAKHHGLPKVFYNRSQLPKGLSNDPTRAYGVASDVNVAAMQISPQADVPTAMVGLMNTLVDTTRDFMGTSDSALGNIRPDNTSAIIATQKATAAPLMIQQMNFYQYVRECIRIIIDCIANYYGSRIVRFEKQVDEFGMEANVPVILDFDSLNLDELELDIEVGQAAYWSEVTTVQTLDGLLKNGILPMDDPEAMKIYLDAMPPGYLPSKSEILDYYEKIIERAALAQQAASLADQMQAEQAINNAGGAPAPVPEAMPQMQPNILMEG